MAEFNALRVAEQQLKNKEFKLPFDYGAILTYRKHAPDLFAELPSDEECKRELVKLGHKEWNGESLTSAKRSAGKLFSDED